MKRTLKKLVFVEPKSTHLHIYSRICIPRLGSVLLATIMRNKGYDVRVFIEDIHAIDMDQPPGMGMSDDMPRAEWMV